MITLRHLVFREMLYRRGRLLLGILSVLVAVGSFVGAFTLLQLHETRTQTILQRKEQELRRTLEALNDQIRRTMLSLGFNVVILPKDQNLADFHAEDFAAKDMPEEYVTRLARSKLITIRHLLPSLQQKIDWPEIGRRIILIGTRGEAPLLHEDPKQSMSQPVPPGGIVLGYELHRDRGLKLGDQVSLLGRQFTVQRLHDERGNKDDITAWIELSVAQDLLNKKGRINAILALECFCEGPALPQVRREIAGILPETQVIERSSEALTRSEARAQVEADGKTRIEQERQARIRLQRERERFAAILVPLVMAACAVWIGLLTFLDTRERRLEIAILRALGLGTLQVLFIFLAKALVIGLIGGLLGVAAGVLAGAQIGTALEGGSVAMADLLRSVAAVLGFSLLMAPVLSIAASWIPALLAAQQHPADILREA
ncbi:MAG: hypothetical protein HYV35_08695 [Lentisphaerae bacterium]|nr:hypothetical protein [Lentisphaerota bacterium]